MKLRYGQFALRRHQRLSEALQRLRQAAVHLRDAFAVLVIQDAQEIVDVRIEVNRRTGQPGVHAQSRVGRGEENVSRRRHQGSHFFPGPSRRPRAVSQ